MNVRASELICSLHSFISSSFIFIALESVKHRLEFILEYQEVLTSMYHQKTTQILFLFFLQLSYTTYSCSINNNSVLYNFCIYLGKSTTFSFRLLCGAADLFLALL